MLKGEPTLVSNGLLASAVILDGGPPVEHLVIGLPSGVTLLYGENGAGKTTILDGIASALTGVRRPAGEARLICRLTETNSCFDSTLLARLIHAAASVDGVERENVDAAVDALRGVEDTGFDAYGDDAHAYAVAWLRAALASHIGPVTTAGELEICLVATGTATEPGWDAFVAQFDAVPATYADPRLQSLCEREAFVDVQLSDMVQIASAGSPLGWVRLGRLGHIDACGAIRAARATDTFDIEAATLDFVRARYRDEEINDAWEAAELVASQVSSSATVFIRELTGADFSLRYTVNNPQDWIEDGLGRWEMDEGGQRWVPVARLGSGWRRWASLAIRFSLSDTQAPAIVLVDEPEAGLHPFAVQSVTRALSAYENISILGARSDGFEEQITCLVATTHHPQVLGAQNAYLQQVSRSPSGWTTASPLDTTLDPTALAQALGWSMPDVLLTTRNFVLVEGIHDQAVIETVFRDELAEMRARVVVMGGASNVGHHINAEFFTRYTSARLIVVLDRLGKAASDLWNEARAAQREGDTDRALRALESLARRDGREADWLGDAGRTALALGTFDRISVVGLEEPDIVRYLPVQEFVPSALSWSALGRPTRGQDYKEWLRTVHKAPVHVENIRAAAAKIDDLKDLPAILQAMR